jgi:rod shape-determining protein MreD
VNAYQNQIKNLITDSYLIILHGNGKQCGATDAIIWLLSAGIMHSGSFKCFLLAFIFLSILILESALFRIIPSAAMIPALHLIVIYDFSVRYYSKYILILFFITGIVVDILFYNHIGISSLLFIIFAQLVSRNRCNLILQNFYKIFVYFSVSIILFYLGKTFLIFELFGEFPNMRDLLLHMIVTIMAYPISCMILKSVV